MVVVWIYRKKKERKKRSWDILECDLNWYIEIRRDDGQDMLQKKIKIVDD